MDGDDFVLILVLARINGLFHGNSMCPFSIFPNIDHATYMYVSGIMPSFLFFLSIPSRSPFFLPCSLHPSLSLPSLLPSAPSTRPANSPPPSPSSSYLPSPPPSHLHSQQHHLTNPSAPTRSPFLSSSATSTFNGLSTSGYRSSMSMASRVDARV